MYYFAYKSPIGQLTIRYNDNYLLGLSMNKVSTEQPSPQNSVLNQTADQLNAYFAKPRFEFTLPYQINGTAFQQKVWQALKHIPPGQTLTYGSLAKSLHTSPRAIGNACRTNPFLLIIPCHRVTGINHLGGFVGENEGESQAIKRYLLEHENAIIHF